LSLKIKVDGLSVVWDQNHWDGFSSGCASKPMAMVCEWFSLKTTGTIFFSLTSKVVATASFGLASKSVVDFLVEPQSQGGGGFSGLGLKTDSSGLMI
jgi:hypothetical protein